MFTEPKTLDQFRQYILMQLGSPMICVEVPPIIIDQIVMDTVGWWWKYSRGIGTHEEYIALRMTPGKSKFRIPNLQAIGEIAPVQAADGINVLFSPMHNLLYRDWVIFGQYPGGPNDGSQGLSLAGFDISMMYLKDIDRAFGTKYRGTYDSEREVLSIFPEPKFEHILLVKAFVRQAPQFLFKDPLFRRHAVAKTRSWWAQTLGKFEISIPGGGKINADTMYQRAFDEITKIEEQLVGESEPPVFGIG